MAAKFTVGDIVHTCFGKGVIRQLQNNRRLLVDVQGRAVVFSDTEVTTVASSVPAARRRTTSKQSAGTDEPGPARNVVEIDLHGLTVEAALVRVEAALNDALLADAAGLRIIHGRSGGRLKAAVHQLLRQLSVVRNFRVDPRNGGVTIVMF
jgi:dsDNA-specific endonuclease/ATPase MutS2